MKNLLWRVNADNEAAEFIEEEVAAPQANEVQIKVAYSSINYKDALGFSSRGKIFRKFPITPGIDLSGTVEASESSAFSPGQNVVVTGTGLGENYDGGYRQYANVDASHVVALPEGMTSENAMLMGTAGFTAALALERLEALGQEKGKILVSGSSGGVGSIATLLFAKEGYEVIAQSQKPDIADYLKNLGASEVLSIEDLALGDRPLEKARFAGAIDNLGGDFLAKLCRHIDLYGNIASIGLATGSDFQSSVMPFILRGVSIVGISSNNCPMPLRKKIWQRLAKLNENDFSKIQKTLIRLEEVDQYIEAYFQRSVVGRVVVKNT